MPPRPSSSSTTLEHDSTASLKKKQASDAKAASEKKNKEEKYKVVQVKRKSDAGDVGPQKVGHGKVSEAMDDQKYLNKMVASLDEKDLSGPKQLSAAELADMSEAAKQKHLSLTQKAKEAVEEEKAREDRKRMSFLSGEADEFEGMSVAEILKEKPEVITDFKPSVKFSQANGLAVYSVTYSHKSDMLVSTGHDRCLTILRPTGTIARKCKGMKGWTLCASFAPDDAYVCVCASDEMYLWDPHFGTLKATWEAHYGMVNGCHWSYSGKYIATCGQDMTCKLWNVKDALKKGNEKYKPPIGSHHDGENENPMMPCVHTYPQGEETGHTAAVVRAVFSHDDMLLASAAKDKKVILWNVERGVKHLELRGHQESVLGLCWNSDSSRLASCDHAGKVLVWNPRNDTPVHILEGHSDICYVSMFGREAKAGKGRLFTCGHDCRINVWDSETGELKNSVKVSAKATWVTGAAIDSTNRYIATCSVDPANSVVIWQR